jgi:hypothetical protein
MMNGLLFKPGRSCLKKIGEPNLVLTKIASVSNSGAPKIRQGIVINRSKKRFANFIAVGVEILKSS